MIDRFRVAPHGLLRGFGREVTSCQRHSSQWDYMACEKKYKLSKIGGTGTLGAVCTVGKAGPVGLPIGRRAGGGPPPLGLAQRLSDHLPGRSAGREKTTEHAHDHGEDQPVQQ